MVLQITTIAFLTGLIILFHICPKAFRKYLLLLASVAFIYTEGGVSGLVVLAAITLITWIVGLCYGAGGMDSSGKGRRSENRLITVITIAALALILFGWKYIPWLMQQLGAGAVAVEGEEAAEAATTSGLFSAGIPIGLSFYTFQAISYIADLYAGKIRPEKNFFKYALYMMWFPKWMSGPIERAGDFLEQIDSCGSTKLLDFDRFQRAASYLIWGMFMKLVIADRIGTVVDVVFEDIPSYGFFTLMLASLLYTIQIYCDFAGYTNSMIGISTMFGLELTQNFKTPYFSESTVEFWRRWHISLSNFLRDYVYIPLGGNRKGEGRKMLNTLVVFFVCGMWHGAGLSFIVWGLLHGCFNIITNLIKDTKVRFLVKGVSGKIITFCLVSFAWIFFRAASISQAFAFVKGMIPGVNTLAPLAGLVAEESQMLGISVMEWWIAGLSILLLTLLDLYASKKKSILPELVSTRWGDFGRGIFLAVILVAVLIFGKYGAGEDIRAFVYQSF